MLIDLAKGLFEALETAFVCSAWLFKPQFRILQVVLIGSTSGEAEISTAYANKGKAARTYITRVR